MHSANPFVFGKFMSVQRTDLGAFGAIWVGIWVGTLVSLQVNPLPDDMGELGMGSAVRKRKKSLPPGSICRFRVGTSSGIRQLGFLVTPVASCLPSWRRPISSSWLRPAAFALQGSSPRGAAPY